MKKLIAVVAILSFAAGLNATISKEDVYQSNPTGFDKIKVELQTLNKAQNTQVKQAFQKEQINKAIKTLLTDKAVLNNANYALIKNGKIVKSSKANDQDGITFWHEHAAGVQNAPAPYTCHIYDPSWENITFNTPCGILKYQMSPDSVYAGINTLEARIALVKDSQDNIEDIENTSSDTVTYAPQNVVNSILYPTEHDDGQTQLFRSFQVVEDIIPFAGYLTTTPSKRLYKPIGEDSYDIKNNSLFNNSYKTTEYNYNGKPIKTLKDGSYIELLVIYYEVGSGWWDGYNIVLKWFRVNVENFYGVDVNTYNQNNSAKITFDNQHISVVLDDSVNPAETTCEIYDISGKLLYRQTLLSNETNISLSQFANGNYIIRLKGTKLDLSKKINIAK